MQIFWRTALRHTSNSVLDFQLPSNPLYVEPTVLPFSDCLGTSVLLGATAVLALATIALVIATAAHGGLSNGPPQESRGGPINHSDADSGRSGVPNAGGPVQDPVSVAPLTRYDSNLRRDRCWPGDSGSP